MPKFVIEREIPGVGNLSPQELPGISQTSCESLVSCSVCRLSES